MQIFEKKCICKFTSNLQEYEAITRGLIKGNPSVPVQGSAEETKQVWYQLHVFLNDTSIISEFLKPKKSDTCKFNQSVTFHGS